MDATHDVAHDTVPGFDRDAFARDGYAVFPAWFPPDHQARAARALDEVTVRRRALQHAWTPETPTRKSVLGHPYFDALITDELMLRLARTALGPDFRFHHGNGRVLEGGDDGTPWHHDYDGQRSTREWRAMVHVLVYPDGLTEDTGPLLVIPGSHRMPVDRAFPRRLGSQPLPEAVPVTGPPGLAVLADSGIWHRRSENRSTGRRRYFQFSYCEPGPDWPERAELDRALVGSRSRIEDRAPHDTLDMLLPLGTDRA